MAQSISSRLLDIFVNELGVDAADVTDDLQYNLAPEWDSVGHMHLIAAIEEQFGLEIPDEDVVEMTSYGKVRAILSRLASDQ